MTREEAIEMLTSEEWLYDEHNFTENEIAAIKSVCNPWHKVSEELPPIDTEVVCKMKGVPYTEHFICKWDGKYWSHWAYFGEGAQGWFGLNIGWKIVEWKEI